MRLIFNELSVLPLIDDEYIVQQRFIQLFKIFRIIQERYNSNSIIFPNNIGDLQVTTDKNLIQLASAIRNPSIFSLIRKPFANEVFKENNASWGAYFYEYEGEERQCLGLALSYELNSLTISIAGHPNWESTRIFFKRLNESLESEEISVLNISLFEHLDNEEILRFLEENSGEPNLIISEVEPKEKPVHFRDDHGLDVLTAFANRITNSPYVKGVINSLPFNSFTVRFINRIYSDGKIEIVLYWEDKGYGMIIQTTGRNLRETQAIADILRNEYDR